MKKVVTLSMTASSFSAEETLQERFCEAMAERLTAGQILVNITHDSRTFKKAYFISEEH